MSNEQWVEQVNDWCCIVDRPEMKLVGIALTITYESRGYGGFHGFQHASCILNDYMFTKKLIAEGEMLLLRQVISERILSQNVVMVRTDISGDGNYKVVVGYEVDSLEGLPECMPEYTETLVIPSCRYAKLMINEQQRSERVGYKERMHADEFFVSAFRQDTSYVYNAAGLPMNMYDETGDILAKYEPVRIPANDSERFDSLQMKLVMLPKMKIACSMTAPDAEEFVIAKYFDVQDKVFATEAAQYYLHDYYGFPVPAGQEGAFNSCFGTRVSSFEGLPDDVEHVMLPGGMYLHISQLEVNGDNPSILYDVAFNHLEELFLSSHPAYSRDWSRQLIARFRQANCASLFVPLTTTTGQ